MTMENNEFGGGGKDDHVFGISDVLSGNEYEPGTVVKVLVTTWNGRREYKTKDNKIKRAGHYKVFEDGVTKEFRLSIGNEVWLAKRGGIKSYEDLVGRELWLKVVFYNLGNGFVITAVSKSKAGTTAGTPSEKAEQGQQTARPHGIPGATEFHRQAYGGRRRDTDGQRLPAGERDRPRGPDKDTGPRSDRPVKDSRREQGGGDPTPSSTPG